MPDVPKWTRWKNNKALLAAFAASTSEPQLQDRDKMHTILAP